MYVTHKNVSNAEERQQNGEEEGQERDHHACPSSLLKGRGRRDGDALGHYVRKLLRREETADRGGAVPRYAVVLLQWHLDEWVPTCVCVLGV